MRLPATMILVTMIGILMMVTACSETTNTNPSPSQPPTQTEAAIKPLETTPAAVKNRQTSNSIVSPLPTGPQTSTADPEIQELLLKHKTVKSLKTIVDNGKIGSMTIIMKGDKIKKLLNVPPIYDNNTVIDAVYIDRSKKTAYGACFDTFVCSKGRREKAFFAEYATENPETPLDIIKQVTTAKRASQEQFDQRPTIIIEYNNTDGRRERLWVDKYSGLPLRQKVLDDENNVLEEHTFTETAINSNTDADVSIPNGFEIVNQ